VGVSIIPEGAAVPISLLLADGDGTKHPQASIHDETGVHLQTLNLAHATNGLYVPAALYFMPDTSFITVVFVVYDDAGHTIESTRYNRVSDSFQKADYATLASVVDGPLTIQTVLSRLNAMAAGKIVRTGNRYAYRDHADTNTLFTNEDQDSTRVPV
jgi:hypothetical protein